MAAINPDTTVRETLSRRVGASRERLVELCAALVRARSENPPGDTREVAEIAMDALNGVQGATVEFVTAEYPIVNLVARLSGAKQGRRLIFNGHLDTFPIGDPARWSVDPLGGVLSDGRIYGRGVSDMKGGLACSMMAFMLLAEIRHAWQGEVVLTLAGDEETMTGHRGTQYLLDTLPHAVGDAMICGDAGSPMVIRFGEKGMLWIDVTAKGRAAHGAHVHLGENAIERLLDALRALAKLRRLPVSAPSRVTAAIRKASRLSQSISGAGETRVLQSVTVNYGLINGGSAANLVPDRAEASLDIRLPVGVSLADMERRVAELLDPLEGISYRVTRRYEPNWTDPGHEIVGMAVANGRAALGHTPAINMRVGASDARLYRLRRVPSIVCGLTPHNMGGPDEYVTLDDLFAVCYIHTMTAFDFLSQATPTSH